jgi:ABC-2 type transport system ATP-binding protein
MTGVVIRVEALVRDFGAVRALDHISFEVPAGVVFGFLGPNGAGKTTVIRVLLGLVDATAGRAEVFGLDPQRDGDRIRERAGALLEHHGLYERLTAFQNLDFFGRTWRLARGARHDRIRELLTQFGLWDRRDDVVGKWSRGMKQKLAVARAVLHRPPLVFLDEPSAGLDPVASAALREDLARLAALEGVTIFLTTHNLAEAERLCALVGVIREGKLVGYGPPAELRARRTTPAVLVAGGGLDNGVAESLGAQPGIAGVERVGEELRVTLGPEASVPALVQWLVSHGVQVEEVRRERATFEHAFLDLMAEGPAVGGRTP